MAVREAVNAGGIGLMGGLDPSSSETSGYERIERAVWGLEDHGIIRPELPIEIQTVVPGTAPEATRSMVRTVRILERALVTILDATVWVNEAPIVLPSPATTQAAFIALAQARTRRLHALGLRHKEDLLSISVVHASFAGQLFPDHFSPAGDLDNGKVVTLIDHSSRAPVFTPRWPLRTRRDPVLNPETVEFVDDTPAPAAEPEPTYLEALAEVMTVPEIDPSYISIPDLEKIARQRRRRIISGGKLQLPDRPADMVQT